MFMVMKVNNKTASPHSTQSGFSGTDRRLIAYLSDEALLLCQLLIMIYIDIGPFLYNRGLASSLRTNHI